VPAESCDRVTEVEIHAHAGRADAAALVDGLLRAARRDVTRGEVAEARVMAFEVVVALGVRYFVRRARIALLQRHPYASVVAQRLAHERQLRLVVAARRDACGMDLREARIREPGTAAVCPPD